MKKHKSVVAILLATMMIFTMMPMMAFATVTWSDDYKTATTDVKNHVPLGVNITWTTGSGLMTATTYDASASTYGTTANATDDLNQHAYFYDLAGATFKASGKNIPASMGYDAFKAIADGNAQLSLALVQPSYTAGYNAATADKTAQIAFNNNLKVVVGKWTLEAVVEGFDPKVTNADQTVTLKLKKTAENIDAADVLGTVDPITITVKGTADSYKSAKVAVDGKTNKATSWTYDGEEHTIALVEAGNATIKYELFNETTGKFDVKTDLKFKDAGSYTWKASATDPTDATKVTTFGPTTTKIDKAAGAKFGFDEDGNNGSYAYRVAPEEKDAFDIWTYVVVDKAEDTAAAANEALILEYVKDFYTIDSVTKKATADKTEYTLRAKTEAKDGFTDADAKALKDGKYKTLLANMAEPVNTPVAAKKATVTFLTSNDYEVEFTKPVTSKVYKGKKTTNKGKLKKNQSFTVKAEAANGAAVSYKLINAPAKIVINKTTGKITVKKGLTKGTYKIKVKAYVPGMQQYDVAASETQAITIKIKK